MLVLSRKKNQRIRVNDDIAIVVVEIRGDKVRLGVEAPPDVTVHREEVWQAIRQCGGNYSFAHLWDGDRYLGPTKCSTKTQATAAVARHRSAAASHWGLVTASEDRPIVDRDALQG